MSRPQNEYPTPGELAVLNLLWSEGPLSGREVMDRLNEDGKDRAYTSVTSLLNVMAEKGLVRRDARGRGYVYAARVKRDRTTREMLRDLVGRAFEGSASSLVAALLSDSKISVEELEAIRRTILEHADE